MNDMIDMSRFIEAKSDQLNADDLIGTTRTITVTRVVGCDGDQPIAIHYEGDNGKPFKPCKTIRRVLMAIWGKYANEYVGRSMTVYRDDKVTFGGLDVGGIRISHMSHLDKETVVVVMKSKGKKAGMKILPLANAPAQIDKAAKWVENFINELGNSEAAAALAVKHAKTIDRLKVERPELYSMVQIALKAVQPTDNDPFGLPPLTETHDPQTGEVLTGPADTDRGEAHTTADAEADILAHLARKARVQDVDALVASRRHELDGAGQDRLLEAASQRIAEIHAA